MRIPADHFLLRKYIEDFGMNNDLFDFEMENKFIYLSGYDGGRTFTYDEFDNMLVAMDKTLMKLFPGLKDNEKGKTCDDLFATAVQPVVDAFWKAYDALQTDEKETSYPDPGKIKRAYGAITKLYDQYSLRSYLIEVAGWSQDALNLYDLGNAHVVFENGFIESWKDAFLSSNSGGGKAGMQQLQGGMDTVPKAFVDPARGKDSLIDNITFGARVTHIGFASEPGIGQSRVAITYQNNSQKNITVESDYLILAIPYTSQRTISKSVAFAPYQEMAIREVRYVEVTKILLQYKTRWWETIFTKNNQGLDGGMVCDLPIRYTMFPKTAGNRQAIDSNRGVVMAAYTFEQDATILGSQSPSGRIEMAAANLDTVFPTALSLNELEVGVSQVFPADEMSGGSAFCYFGPTQKSVFLDIMCQSDWNERAFFAGEQASYTHGWIQGAFEAGLRCVQQVYAAATEAVS
jgi:monoamine oxidase